jgi:hypothetical protein
MDPVTSVVIVSAIASGLTLLERIVSKLMKVKKSKCCGGEIEFGPDSPRPEHHEHAEPESTTEQDKEGKK